MNIIKNKKNKLGGDIKVKRKDIIDVSRKVDEQFSETSAYREKVITNNPIVHIRNNQTEVSESIVLSKVTHMIGQVGAGKSTLINCLNDNENILMVVNKYDQATIVCDYLNSTLSDYGYNRIVTALRSDSDSNVNKEKLFVIIQQIFGRLCRIADLNNMKCKPIKVYFMDGAFRSKKEGQYDFLKELILYLEGLMANDKSSNIVKSLYEPFYLALKKGGNISDEA